MWDGDLMGGRFEWMGRRWEIGMVLGRLKLDGPD
jgi:hypothetical protein